MSIRFAVLVFVVCLFIGGTASAQFAIDTSFIRILSDTVVISNVNIDANCNTKFVTTATVSNDTVWVTECDTSTRHATCDCYYDNQATVTGLSPGTYHAMILRQELKKYQYSKDTTVLVADLVFTVGGRGVASSVQTSSGSCHEMPEIVSVSENPFVFPHLYLLEQNYPNPFNPTTNFGFRIVDCSAAGGSASGGVFVSLKVYDVLGREVVTLVNEVKQPGEYGVMWNAANVPGGVYFYKIMAGKFSSIKKMSVIK